MNDLNYDVVVVGGGPVGLTVASLLGRSGHRVALLERFAEVYRLPRAIRFDGELMRIFQGLGIVDAIDGDIVAMDGYRWFGADDQEIVYIDSSAPAPSGWATSYAFWQPALEGALDRLAGSIDTVDVLRGWVAEEILQRPESAEVAVRHGTEPTDGVWVPADETRRLRAAYVVGADGANSTVREATGITQTDLGFNERWLVVDVRPHDMSRWEPRVAEQHCIPARPRVQVGNGPSHRRWEFMLLPGEDADAYRDPATVWRLLEPHLRPDEGELVRHAVYEFRSTVADTMNVGRVLLAGDAAHVMPPFMGEGMCSGVRDAGNLAWRLDLILRGIGDERLLDAYTEERRPHNEALIRVSLEMGKVSCTIDPAAAAARDAAFRSGAVPPPPSIPHLLSGTLRAGTDPAAGRLTVQGVVRTPDGSVGRLDDVVGAGFALVCRRGSPREILAPDQTAFLAELGVRLVTLATDVPGALADEDGVLTGWMDALGIDAFLARPDGYGFGSVPALTELPGLIDEFRSLIA